MTARTVPSIQVAQNTVRARRLIAAQARLYSDAKTIHNWRLGLVFFFALATSVCALALQSMRQVIGASSGLVLFVVALLVNNFEKRRRFQAAAIQEEFDTTVFQLDWNGLLAERACPIAVAKSAVRYNGGRDANWYPDTQDAKRPFDILICQTSNLGWGVFLHRVWARILIVALVVIFGVIGVVGWLFDLSFPDFVIALIVPALAPAKELLDLIRANLDNASSKETTERKILEVWKNGLGGQEVSLASCRAVQDQILHIRQSNAYVPDWLDRVCRTRNEAAMRLGADAMIEEAKERGYA